MTYAQPWALLLSICATRRPASSTLPLSSVVNPSTLLLRTMVTRYSRYGKNKGHIADETFAEEDAECR